MLKQGEFISSLAAILKQARQDKKYTLEKLAEKSETDYSTVNLIENGKQNPKIYTVYRLLYALDIDINELITNHNTAMQDSRFAVTNRLAQLDTKTLEAIYELTEQFELSKK
jgi:transcriptional regulator with XRE-family HTH domain